MQSITGIEGNAEFHLQTGKKSLFKNVKKSKHLRLNAADRPFKIALISYN